MHNSKTSYLSVGIDIGADFSLMSVALPTQEIVGNAYRINHDNLLSIQGAISRIRGLESEHNLQSKVFMESTSIYHLPLYYRFKDEEFEVFVLNPLITHANRNINIRSIHNDKFDSQKIALIGLKPKLKISVIPDDYTAAVKVMMREYHSMKKECTMLACRLTSQLRQTFPQYLKLFSQINGNTSLEILYRYTTPENIMTADKDEFVALIAKASSRNLTNAECKYEQLVQAATQANSFGHSNNGNIILIRHIVEMIRFNQEQTQRLLEKIEQIIYEQPNSKLANQIRLIESIPGAGFVTAATVACEIGDFSAFRRPKHLYAYFGLDPKVRQSGHFTGTELKMSKRGSPYARRSIYILALQSISVNKNREPKNPVLREYYLKKCESKAKMTAIGAVMHKVCNIIFAVLRDEKPFALVTPQQHLEAYTAALDVAA